MPVNSVFFGRRFNSQIYNEALGDICTDWILREYSGWLELKRELTLAEKWIQKNRYIYIHGTPYEEQLGNLFPQAASECQTRTLLNCLTMFK